MNGRVAPLPRRSVGAPSPSLFDRLRARLGLADGPHLRPRLELAASVLATGLAVTALGAYIQPTPKVLARASSELESAVRVETQRAAAQAASGRRPAVDPEFAAAVRQGELKAMTMLYQPGMALDGMLSLAAKMGNVRVAAWLLDHGADPTDRMGIDESPLILADPHPDMVKLLLSRGVPEPPLLLAAESAAPNAVARQLASKADVNPEGFSLVARAIDAQRPFAVRKAVVDMLLTAGADVRKVHGGASGDPLASAASACDTTLPEPMTPEQCGAMLEDLIARGARGTGAALAAAMDARPPLRERAFRAVLAAEAVPGAPSVALATATSLSTDHVKELIHRGVDWAWRDGEEDAAMPLVAAVQRGDRDAVRILLDAGAPADRSYKSGTTALAAALEGLPRGTEFARIVELLVARGASPSRRLPDGRSPLFAAAETGDVRVLTFLLDRGANPNDLVLDDSALDAAEQNGQVAAARVLHARGGRRNRKPSF